jgi:hypothetical protein
LENEGYFEAARVPCLASDFTVDSTTGVAVYNPLSTGIDISNHQTYMSGKLRDISRFQFKLNSHTTNHDFVNLPATPDASYVSQDWDLVIIKIHGRADSTSPSMLMFDCVSNQEIIYTENTSLARLMTQSARLSSFDSILDKSKYPMPALQIE